MPLPVLDFPASPTLDQRHPDPVVTGQPQYRWDGQVWLASDAAADATDVSVAEDQTFTEEQKAQGRENIGAVSADELAAAVEGSVLYDVAQSLTPAQQSQARANIDVTKKNYIINGAMMISQELPINAAGAAVGYYADQFRSQNSSTAVLSHINALVATPGGSINRFRITVTTADISIAATDTIYIEQKIEGYRVADLQFGSAAAKTITIQFGCKGPAGTYGVALLNAGNSRSYVAEYVIAPGEANTDVMKSVTIPGDTTGTWETGNLTGLYVRWGLTSGVSFQQAAGVWGTSNVSSSPNQFNFGGTNGSVFELFDVSLTEGTVAPPFVVPDYASELLACQRHYIRFRFSRTYVAVAATYTDIIPHNFPVQMRTAPTVTLVNSSTTNATTSGVSAGDNTYCTTYMTGATGPANTAMAATIVASARL